MVDFYGELEGKYIRQPWIRHGLASIHLESFHRVCSWPGWYGASRSCPNWKSSKLGKTFPKTNGWNSKLLGLMFRPWKKGVFFPVPAGSFQGCLFVLKTWSGVPSKMEHQKHQKSHQWVNVWQIWRVGFPGCCERCFWPPLFWMRKLGWLILVSWESKGAHPQMAVPTWKGTISKETSPSNQHFSGDIWWIFVHIC